MLPAQGKFPHRSHSKIVPPTLPQMYSLCTSIFLADQRVPSNSVIGLTALDFTMTLLNYLGSFHCCLYPVELVGARVPYLWHIYDQELTCIARLQYAIKVTGKHRIRYQKGGRKKCQDFVKETIWTQM